MKAMYYICKFSDTWSIYDGTRNNSRPLDNKEVECLKVLFPGLLLEAGKLLTAIQVSSINPAKLLHLPNPESQGTAKRKEA
jgi:hypothetical protein